MSSSLQSRKEELLAKKARLAELKRQRELRQEQFAHGRQSIGGEVCTYTSPRSSLLLTLQRARQVGLQNSDGLRLTVLLYPS